MGAVIIGETLTMVGETNTVSGELFDVALTHVAKPTLQVGYTG